MSVETSSYPMALENFSPSPKEGWAAFVQAPPRVQPEWLTHRRIRALSKEPAAEYNERRSAWRANLGPLNTPQLAALNEDLWDIVDSNAHDAHKAKAQSRSTAIPDLANPSPPPTSRKTFTAAKSPSMAR
jgi:hypothetical protein